MSSYLQINILYPCFCLLQNNEEIEEILEEGMDEFEEKQISAKEDLANCKEIAHQSEVAHRHAYRQAKQSKENTKVKNLILC